MVAEGARTHDNRLDIVLPSFLAHGVFIGRLHLRYMSVRAVHSLRMISSMRRGHTNIETKNEDVTG